MAGRGRLSSIDLLPEEAADDIVWACQQLAERKRTQADILFELNDRLEAKGLEPVSKSAFNRRSMRLAAAQRRMAEARAMYEGLAEKFDGKSTDESTIVLGEFLKTLVLELVDDGAGEKTAKEAMELARAFRDTVAAQKISTDRTQKIDEAVRLQAERLRLERSVNATADMIEAAGGTVDRAGLLKRIREDVYGIFDAQPAPASRALPAPKAGE